MPVTYYRLLTVLAASLSLLTASCGENRPTDASIPIQTKLAVNTQRPVTTEPDGMDTEATIFTVLGMAKKPSERAQGPQTGEDVSPSLWNAAHDTLNFVPLAAEDPAGGVIRTEWYSPPQKPKERLRVTVLILARALRTDSLAVTIDREERAPGANWTATPVAQQSVDDLEAAILLRARQIHAEIYRNSM